jgi:hypothetical protein
MSVSDKLPELEEMKEELDKLTKEIEEAFGENPYEGLTIDGILEQVKKDFGADNE